MGVVHNMVTPRHGQPLVASTQDFLSAWYLITQKDVFFSRTEFWRLAAYIGVALEDVHVPPPCIVKVLLAVDPAGLTARFAQPIQLWSGKQLFDIVLRPNDHPRWPIVNIEIKAANFEGVKSIKLKDGTVLPPITEESNHWMCPRDGYVVRSRRCPDCLTLCVLQVIRNSRLMCGNLCKNTLGGKQDGLFYCLIRGARARRRSLAVSEGGCCTAEHDPTKAAEAMNRVAWVRSHLRRLFSHARDVSAREPLDG